MSADLNAALAARLGPGQVGSFYQPLANLSDGAPQAVEALARWIGADGRPHSARAIRNAADDAGLRAGLAIALAQVQLQGFAKAPWAEGLALSINATAADFETGGLAERLPYQAASAGVPLIRLWVELTEEEAPTEIGRLSQAMASLRAAGVRIAVDDFGTGFSSLGWVLRLPIDAIKLDASFTNALAQKQGLAIVRAVAGLGADLGLKLTAEGVQTDDQRKALLGLGYHMGQGALFGMPRPA
jgi:EAL domain-containing protein (putative c-di-GMP-specific phosphodiesterase class I)